MPKPRNRKITAPLCGLFWMVQKLNLRTKFSSRFSCVKSSSGISSPLDEDMVLTFHITSIVTSPILATTTQPALIPKRRDPEKQRGHNTNQTSPNAASLWQSEHNAIPQLCNIQLKRNGSQRQNSIILITHNVSYRAHFSASSQLLCRFLAPPLSLSFPRSRSWRSLRSLIAAKKESDPTSLLQLLPSTQKSTDLFISSSSPLTPRIQLPAQASSTSLFSPIAFPPSLINVAPLLFIKCAAIFLSSHPTQADHLLPCTPCISSFPLILMKKKSAATHQWRRPDYLDQGIRVHTNCTVMESLSCHPLFGYT